MHWTAKEWGDKTLVKCIGGLWPDCQVVMNIPFTEFMIGYNKRLNGKAIQDCFPSLDADNREFLISGCSPEEFDTLFREE